MFDLCVQFGNIFFSGFDFFEKTWFVVLLMSLPGANLVKKHDLYLFDVLAGVKFCKTSRFVFFLMSLLGANFVKNQVFNNLKSFAVLKNNVIGMILSLSSVLERSVLKNYAECTNQRLKPTSGARYRSRKVKKMRFSSKN